MSLNVRHRNYSTNASGIAPLGLGGTREERERDAPWWDSFVTNGGPRAPSSSSCAITPAGGLTPVRSNPAALVEGTLAHRLHIGSEAAAERRLKSEDPMNRLLLLESADYRETKTRADNLEVEGGQRGRKRDPKHDRKNKKAKKTKHGKDKKKSSKSKREKRSRSSSSSGFSSESSSKETERSGGAPQAATGPSMYELRQRRLERERSERVRSAEAVSRAAPGDDSAAFVANLTARRYNSQFF